MNICPSLKKIFIFFLATISILAFSHIVSACVGPTISIDTINDFSKPFSFSCPTNPLSSPVTLAGSGEGSAPPGLIEQYHVQIDWGDGETTNGLGTFIPSTGHGDFQYMFSAGPHSYAPGNYTLTARLYHQQPPGNDNQADTVVSVAVCTVTNPATLNVIKHVINDDGGKLGASDFNLHVKTNNQDVNNSPAAGSETGTVYNLNPGTYVVSEDAISNYNQSISGDCAADGSITLISGDNKTCTITNNDIASQPYCGDGIINGCEECDDGNNIDGDGCSANCQEEESESIIIKAYKVVCEDETDLPNWGTLGLQLGEPSVVSENTAIDYVNNSQGKCWLTSGWDFQWGFDGEVSSPNGGDIGPGGAGWHNFDSSTGVLTPAQVQITDLQGISTIWAKENLKENYVPFAGPPDNLQNDVSAEMYCHDDILNYDNYDYISNVQSGNTYYCVAFNAPTTPSECTPGSERACSTGLLGVCSAGIQTCTQENTWGSCVQTNQPTAENCTNQLDDDCDGFIDGADPDCQPGPGPYCGDGHLDQGEQCDDGNNINGDGCSSTCTTETPQCTAGSQQLCSTGLSGICAIGTKTCSQSGFWGSCIQNNQPTNENCTNGLDDDCDGFVDGSDSNCQIPPPPPPPFPRCQSGTTQSCSTGLPGICAIGISTCGQNGFWGTCVQTTQPIKEICTNGLDDDCDGLVDSADPDCPIECSPGTTQLCPTGLSGVCNTGTRTCNQNGFWSQCVQSIQATNENCTNGLDDDCDGLVDSSDSDCQGPLCTTGAQTACTTGLFGICSGGIQTCSLTGIWGDCIQRSQPRTENCHNGLDDDCDGAVDDADSDCQGQVCVPGSQQLCSTGFLGTCNTGIQECNQAGLWGICVQATQAGKEICDDALDNNCNGKVDCDDNECSTSLTCTMRGTVFGAAIDLFSQTSPNILANIGNILSPSLGGNIYSCLPWWIILILALYPLYKWITIWRKEKKIVNVWFIWLLIFIIFAIWMYLYFPCVDLWKLVILIIITFAIWFGITRKR